MTTLVGLLLAHAESRPEAPAFIDASGTLTYGELARNARTAAAWLAGQGAKPGDTVALALSHEPANPIGALELLYGAAWLGAVVVPLFPDVPEERRAQVASRYGARRIEASGYRRGGSASPPPRGDGPDQPFLIQFTSGTTGEPKSMLLAHEQFAQRSLRVSAALQVAPDDRMLAGRPWPALVGMRSMLRMHCAGAACVNVEFPRTRRQLAEAIRAYGITRIFASPAQPHDLVHEPGPPVELRAFFVGGAPVSAQWLQQARARLCRTLCVTYGTNETGSLAVMRPGDPAGADGCVGRLLPDVQAESVGGELRFRVPGTPQGYLDNPAATAARFRDGWFYPGDLGSIDADGYLTLHGRADDVINHAGVKVNPGEIEAVMLQHPEVAEAAVVGIAAQTGGEVPVAFVVLRHPGALREVEAFCRSRIDTSRLPAAFVGVRALPQNAGGKVDRAQLRQVSLDHVLRRPVTS